MLLLLLIMHAGSSLVVPHRAEPARFSDDAAVPLRDEPERFVDVLELASFADDAAVPSGLSRVHRSLYVGSFEGARHLMRDEQLAWRLNVTAVLNVARDYDHADVPLRGKGAGQRYAMRYVKAGLVDGAGNSVLALAAAVQWLAQLLQPQPHLDAQDRNTYPEARGVLVHCAWGHSRSVTVASLYLYFSRRFPTLDAAVEHVRRARGISHMKNRPQPALLETARRVIQLFPNLLQHI